MIQKIYLRSKVIHILICIFIFSFQPISSQSLINPSDSTSIVFTRSSQTLGDVLTFGMAIADVDLDDDNDIFIGAYGAINASRLWINDGNGSFTLSSQTFGYNTTVPHDVAIANLNDDLYPDIFMANHSGPNKIYFNNGNGSFTIGAQNIGSIGEHPQTIQLEDIDNDGDQDAYIYNSSAPNRIWENDGNGFFTMRNIDYGGDDSGNQFLADFNNDDYPDLFVGMRTGPSQIWMNDGAGNITYSGHTLGGGGEAIDCNDVDDDGDTDIVVAAGGEITIWLNQNNTGTFVSGFTFGEGATECKLFDADLDGDFDLVTGHFENGSKLWINDSTGSFSSIATSFDNLIAYRIECGKLDSDDDYDVLMGVEPGSGGIAIYFNESTIVGVDKKSNPWLKDYILYNNYPNPFNPTTTISYSIPERSFVSLKIYDVLGHEIKVLVDEEKKAGNYKITFGGDGLSSGIYLYQLSVNDFIESKKMILLK
ncbi:FG-GAP-like repeat-containing protein [Bacteroidota bacterium]